jgi:hypothetical protein
VRHTPTPSAQLCALCHHETHTDTEILTPQSITNTHAHTHLDNPPQHDFRHHPTRSGHTHQDNTRPHDSHKHKDYKSSTKTNTKHPTARNHKQTVFHTHYLSPTFLKQHNRLTYQSNSEQPRPPRRPTRLPPVNPQA